MELSLYGWDNDYAAALARACVAHGKTLEAARVVASSRGLCRIAGASGECTAILSGALLREEGAARPVTGDWIAFEPDTGRVQAVLDRRTCVSRKKAGKASEAQVIAANVDVLFLVMGLDGDYNPRRLERYLLLAAESGADPVVVLNKSDLCDDLVPRLNEIDRLCSAPVAVMSAVEPGAAEQLHRYVEPGQTAALVGMSGTGKSTIANSLLGEEKQATSGVRASDGRGGHTTTTRELFLLPQGWLLLDTPGMRELEVWSDGVPVLSAFGDIAQAASRCRFRDCQHEGEPGCAVALAVESGHLDAGRVANFLKLSHEADAQQRKRREKLIGKALKQMQRSGLWNKW
jgi:ribosome biogenesis GTPase / thiamine phosphate phosphatase